MAENKATDCHDNQGFAVKLWAFAAAADVLRNKMAAAITANLKELEYGG